jgi:hypothetical protein
MRKCDSVRWYFGVGYEPTLVFAVGWRGGRVVDGSGLENRRTRKGTGGSNPSLSAIILWVL